MILHIAHKFTLPLLRLLLLLLILLLPFTTTTNTAATTTNNENDIMVYRADEKIVLKFSDTSHCFTSCA